MKLPWPVSLLPNVNTAISSVHFSCSVMSNYLWPNGLHDARLPCSSPTPRTCSKSCPSSWWCHPTISSFVVSSSSWLQSYSATGSFLMSQFFASGDQSMGASASASVFSMNIQDFFPLELSDLISLKSKGLSRVPTPQFKSINSSVLSFLYDPTLTSIQNYWKTIAWLDGPLSAK